MAFQTRMRAIPLRSMALTDPFWGRWREVVRLHSLPHQWEQIVATGRLENFRKAAMRLDDGFEGLYFNDSDVYKWLEAVAYVLVDGANEALRAAADEAIDAIVGAQLEDGYLNTYFQLGKLHQRWRNLNAMHEMYCAGHLFEAAVAWDACLGDRRLVDVSLKFADHIAAIFGPEKRLGYCGHEEIELALMKLGKHASRPDLVDLARWMIDVRGGKPSPFDAEMRDPEVVNITPWSHRTLGPEESYNGEYCQDHLPVREHTDVVGHAVRAMYLYMAAAEQAADTGDEALETALRRAWATLTGRRMYVTGGIGPSAHNEGFTTDYDLPNLSAYAETCAAVALAMWGHRMLEASGDGEFAEIMERALFNGALSGISLDGKAFFYTNPLEARGTHGRTPWFSCACCPPNIARLIGRVTDLAYGVGDRDVWIHFPVAMRADLSLGGERVTVAVESEYPWSGAYKVRVSCPRPTSFALRIRVPDWAENTTTDLPGAEEESGYERGYAVFDRTWKDGDTLSVEVGMEPRWVESDPRVRDNLGRVSLAHGPLVYCLESPDFGVAPQLFTVDPDAPTQVSQHRIRGETTDDDGWDVSAVTVEGFTDSELFPEGLYADLGNAQSEPGSATLIPYFAWANRGKSQMQVWLRRS